MHKKIVVAVSAVQFLLLAFVAIVVSDVHDRFFPEQLDVKAKVTLDFSQSDLRQDDVFQQLGVMSDQWELGLMKVAPDLRGNQSGQIFVQVGQKGDFPKTIQRFGHEPDAKIRDRRALAHSFANGDYLVTGKTDHIDELKHWLASHRVDQKWNEETLLTILQFLIVQSDFGVALLAVSALMVSLVLYWLAVKAKGRALRVLAGVPTSRIQCEDFSHFLLAMILAAAILDVLAALYVGFVAPYRYMIIVNEQWLDIVRRKNKGLSLVPLALEQIPKDAKQFLELSIPLYVRKQQQERNIWREIKMYRLTGSSPFPFVRFGGQLEFARPKDVLLFVAPHVHALFNDNFLISVASSSELSFVGLEETQKLVSERGLQNRIRVNYMAKQGRTVIVATHDEKMMQAAHAVHALKGIRHG